MASDAPDEPTARDSIYNMVVGVRPPGFIRPSVSALEEVPTVPEWSDHDPDTPRRYSFEVDLHGLGYKHLVNAIDAHPDWRYIRQYVRKYRANKDHVRTFIVEEIL